MTARQKTKRVLLAGVCTALVVGACVALPALRDRSDRAYADEVRSEVARSYREARAWRAHVEERELVSEGTYRTTRYRIAVSGPRRYRVESVERDERGREVTAVTVRDGSRVFSSTQVQGEPARVLEIRNVPPTLGAMTDNVLGQRVRDLVRATSARYAGRENIRGRSALRLAVEPGHVAWIDGETSIPVREQLLSGDTVTHELEVLFFEDGTALEVTLFDGSALGDTNRTVEDLGFRPAPASSAPVELLGFTPRPVETPAEWQLVESGYTQPGARSDSAPASPAWIAQYETPAGPVLVTQSKDIATHERSTAPDDGTDGPEVTQVEGRTVAYFADEWRTHATVQIEDVLVVVEGLMAPEDLLPALVWVR